MVVMMVACMSDLLKLLFDLGQLGHELSHSFRDLPDPNSGLGLEARRVSKEPGNRATKSLRYGIQAIKNRKAFACLIFADGSIGDFEHFGQHWDRHSSGVSGLSEFFAKYFCCIHGSLFHSLGGGSNE